RNATFDPFAVTIAIYGRPIDGAVCAFRTSCFGGIVKKVISIAAVMLVALLGSFSAFAQATPPTEAARRAEIHAAWEAAGQAGVKGPSEVTLIDQAKLKLQANYFFVPKAEGMRVLRALGNQVNDATFVGLVVGTGQNDRWIVVIRYVKEGYIRDDDAKNWNA